MEGKPVLGVLGCPNVPLSSSRGNDAKLGEGCIFFAVKGQGAYVFPLQARSVSAWARGDAFCSTNLIGHVCLSVCMYGLCTSGGILEEEIAKAQKIKVSDVGKGSLSRFFESFESAHSSHSVAADVNKGRWIIL